MTVTIGRRELLAALGGAAAWPLAARAQQPEQMRRVGVLMSLAADDAEGKARLAAFLDGLQQLGWIDSRNVRIDARWGAGDADRTRRYAAELVALAPDVILATGSPPVAALQQATRSAAIVFADVGDPVGQGFVETLARPGGNTTGFMLFEYAMGGKWLELLKEIAPGVTRAAVLRDTAATVAGGQLGAIQAAAASLGVELSPVGMRDAGEIERGISTFARSANGGLIVAASTLAFVHRERIITLAARYKLPAVYFVRGFVASGGLIAYGPNQIDPCRRAAGYVDRILKGEKPADLPVQAPTKYELVINLKTAKALNLIVPPTLPPPRRRGDRIALFVLRCIRSLLAPRVISLRCRISEAIGAKRTCREHRERVRGCAGPTPFYDVSDRAINVLQRTTLECPSGHPANSATRLKPAFSYIPGAWKS